MKRETKNKFGASATRALVVIRLLNNLFISMKHFLPSVSVVCPKVLSFTANYHNWKSTLFLDINLNDLKKVKINYKVEEY